MKRAFFDNTFLITAPKPKPEGVMPLIGRFHPNLEENVEEEYVETEDKEAAESGSGETNNGDQTIKNDTIQYEKEETEESMCAFIPNSTMVA